MSCVFGIIWPVTIFIDLMYVDKFTIKILKKIRINKQNN